MINVSWADKWTDAGHWKTSNPSGYSGGEREGIKKGESMGNKNEEEKETGEKKERVWKERGKKKKTG